MINMGMVVVFLASPFLVNLLTLAPTDSLYKTGLNIHLESGMRNLDQQSNNSDFDYVFELSEVGFGFCSLFP